jgi:hypothetical protein
LFHAGVNACAILVWITDLLWLELLAIPNLVVHLVLLPRCAFTNASSPIWILGEALVPWALAAFGAQA